MRQLEQHFVLIVRIALTLGTFCAFYVIVQGLLDGHIEVWASAVLCFLSLLLADVLTFVAHDRFKSEVTEHSLSVAQEILKRVDADLSHDAAQYLSEMMLDETNALAVAITDTKMVIGYSGERSEHYPIGAHIKESSTKEVLKSGIMQTFSMMDQDPEQYHAQYMSDNIQLIPAGIIVPLLVQGRVVGVIKLYYHHRLDIDKTQLSLAYGFGQIISMVLSAKELDKQAELTAKAEVKALQAQINPHFLFNTINTIASLIRTNPQKARELLREFAVFYRKTIKNSESKIPLEQEVEQTNRYLQFEYARFGENRIKVAVEIDPACEHILVPAFIIQPIVENAIKHAMRDEGPLHINILATKHGSMAQIAVVDDGLGMDEKTAETLLMGPQKRDENSKGCGIALYNVAERIERFYAAGSGVEIMSKPDEGTCVTLKLADVFPFEV